MPYALVTGASSGIGADLVQRLLNEKWKVILVARSVDKMQEICKNFDKSSYLIIKCDVTDSSQIKKACEKTNEYCNNKLDLLVNNAGAAHAFDFTIDNCTVDEWDWTMNVNLRQVFLFTKYLKSSLINCGKNASIVNIGSIAGSRPFPNLTAYCVAKAGMNHLTRCNALELSSYGVRCNCIQPATVKTGWHAAAGIKSDKLETYYKNGDSLHPIGRIGYPKDIVNMTMFLANVEQSGWITGECIMMDGGRCLVSPLPSRKKSKL